MQTGVYSLRNMIQYTTIPCGYLLAGWLIDTVWEPMMHHFGDGSLFSVLGAGHKGSGAGLMILLDGCAVMLVCLCSVVGHGVGMDGRRRAPCPDGPCA